MSTLRPDEIRLKLHENRIQSGILRAQLKAAEELERLRQRYQPGDKVDSRHVLPIGRTDDGTPMVIVVPPETTKYDRQRLIDAKHAKDLARIEELCDELGAQITTAEVIE